MSANRQPPSLNLGRLLTAYSEPWFIAPRAFDALWAAALQVGNFAFQEAEDEIVRYSLPHNGVAVIPVHGPIARRPQTWERKYLGVIGQDDIASELHRAVEDSSVRSLLLDIDSPGGHAVGTPELAELVAEVNRKKPVVAFTSGIMASAAYYLSVHASVIVSTGSAHVGCIGTVLSFLDISGWYQQLGIKQEVIVNEGATYKGMGTPGTSLTKEQRAFLQEQITKSGEDFKAAVRKARSVPDDAMRGQTLAGDQAYKARLVDQIGNFGTAHRTAETLAK